MPAGYVSESNQFYSSLSVPTEESNGSNYPKLLSKSVFLNDIPVIANVSSAIMGVSIFAMPWGFLQSGLLGGTIITTFVAYLSFETSRVLLFSQRSLFQKTGKVKSYAEIASETLGGHGWGYAVKVATAISCLGSCVGYLIFLGEICGQLFDVSFMYALIVAVFPLTILAWIRSFRELTVFTIIGVAAIIATIIYVVYDGQCGKHTLSGPVTDAPLFIPSTCLNFVGPATFLFTSHYCVLSMGAEALEESSLKRSQHQISYQSISTDDNEAYPNSIIDQESDTDISSSMAVENLNRPVAVAYALSALLIIVHGSTGFILYRSVDYVKDSTGTVEPGCEGRVCQNIILNLSKGTVRDCIGLILCVAIVVSYVLLLAPAREHIEGSIVKHLSICSEGWITVTRNLVRMGLVILTAVVAICTPYFGTLLGQVGGLTDALQAFVLPPLIYLSMQSENISFAQQIMYKLIFLWGVGTIVYTITSLLNAIL